MAEAKPFTIPMDLVRDAYRRVRANKGSYGIDGESLKDFEEKCESNLYKIWNRMSSGSYMPPAVRRVEIPKKGGGKRPLGIPTVSDRIAQMVVKMCLEPECEVVFHESSFAYRPGKSAHDALRMTRERCWKHSWVLEIDIKSFFDSIDHDLLMKAVKRHTKEPWILLYIGRWLKAPFQLCSGEMEPRARGTPQGGVISPLLANLFLHYVFDKWMDKNLSFCPFERYADDIVIHCRTVSMAEYVRSKVESRFTGCGLTLHPVKTRIVYCKFGRTERYGVGSQNVSFDFLGFTFKPRRIVQTGQEQSYRWAFLPAISNKSKNSVFDKIRKLNLNRRSKTSINEIAEEINPLIRGWMQYYGIFSKTELKGIFDKINFHIAKWAKRKYGMGDLSKSFEWLDRVSLRSPDLFAHWKLRVC
jgi:RNA-directed DNA polymerase